MLFTKDAVLFLLSCMHLIWESLEASPLVGSADIRVERFEQCPDKLNIPNVFTKTVTILSARNDISIDGLITLRQRVEDPASLKVVFTRCDSKDTPSTCEYYFTYSNKEFCKLLDMEGMPWTLFLRQTTLPRSCPFEVGNYSMNGARISMILPDSPNIHGFWKMRSSGKSKGKLWHCAIAEFTISPALSKRKKNKKQG